MKNKIRHLRDSVNECSERTKRKKLGIFVDMVLNRIIFNVSIEEYCILECFNRGFLHGKNIITKNLRNRVVKEFNDPSGIEVFENKALFNQEYRKYVNRFGKAATDVSKGDLESFQLGKQRFLLKPVDGGQGKNIEIVNTERNKIDEFLAEIKTKGNFVLEEYLEQHEQLDLISPNGLSVIRFLTFGDKLFSSFITLSIDNTIVNYHTGGIVCLVDIDSGAISTDGTTKDGQIFAKHPVTGVKLNGFKLPEFSRAKRLVLEAAMVTPSVRYVGWDVAISKDDPVIIEGNARRPGITTFQLPIFNNNDFATRYKRLLKRQTS